MSKPTAAAISKPPAAVAIRVPKVNPLLVIGCGAVLIVGGEMVRWLDPDPASQVSAQSRVVAPKVQPPSYQQREAQARAEQERLEAERVAAESAKRVAVADVPTEAKARTEQEEMASKRAAVNEAQRAAAENEQAWKRFYKPSAACADPATSASVECVNAFIRAKREFAERYPNAALPQ